MISDALLHACVDGQLDSRELAEVLARAARSPELAARLAALRRLKELLQHAYPGDTPAPTGTDR
jgi:anti-sigma factor RsiW